MKKSIKLLLLAALAWPSLALAQGQPQALPVDKPKVFEHAGDASKLRQHESCTHDMKATKLEDINADASSPDTTPGRSNAPRKQPQRESEYLYINENATNMCQSMAITTIIATMVQRKSSIRRACSPSLSTSPSGRFGSSAPTITV